ncbi:6504_t:CDS:2 [Entrophospora sp. SA101]|nr:12236_t:CDS:2 [Entrophospora sp. SA101]CAJ0634516.1 2427_t:CDS:2 [Entrophospora sp. SA101]CAJ0634523.1 2433_t:CDS:2 [Entrophospora sp. SA101]CAJ0751224.1 6504_t:CDS:2 [Entrophospora sp. SA101]CAJ0876795.1 12755_t:CDS:2 [Entrophospora sp. SA101]
MISNQTVTNIPLSPVCSSLPTPPPIKDYSNKKDIPDHKQALMQSDNVDFVEFVGSEYKKKIKGETIQNYRLLPQQLLCNQKTACFASPLILYLPSISASKSEIAAAS